MQAVGDVMAVVAGVFAVVGIGACARAVGWLRREADQGLMRGVVWVLMPMFFVDQLLRGGDTTRGAFASMAALPVVGFVTTAGGIGLALCVAHGIRRPLGFSDPNHQLAGRERRTFGVAAGMYNYGYLPYPLTLALFDEEVLRWVMIHNLGVDLAMWTVAVFVMAGGWKHGWHKRLLTPPTAALLACLLIDGTGHADQTPAVLRQTASLLGPCAIPVALLLIGATVCDEWRAIRDRPRWRVLIGGALIRLGLLPACFVGAALLLPSGDAWTPARHVLVIQAAMPAAQFPIVLARLYDGDAGLAIRVNLSTTLLSLATMPLWIAAGRAWVL